MVEQEIQLTSAATKSFLVSLITGACHGCSGTTAVLEGVISYTGR